MRSHKKTILCLLFHVFALQAQHNISYYQHIAPLVEAHCMPCHSKGGDASFALSNYEQVSQKAATIAHVTARRLMPPYPANPHYRHFANENYLNDRDIALVAQWVAEGKNLGNKPLCRKRKRPKLPKSTAAAKSAVHAIGVPQALPILGDNKDRFERVLLPTELSDSTAVVGFAFRNTNRPALHHSELMICSADDCATTSKLDKRVGDSRSYEGGDIGGNYSYLSGWLPGQSTLNGDFFPIGFAKILPPQTNFLYLLHYGPSPIDQTDSAGVLLYTVPTNSPLRPVESIDLHGTQAFGKNRFVIPPDTIITLHNQRRVDSPFSVFAILPHAHHLAQKMRAYALTPTRDTIPLLQIDRWRFAWQWQYKLPQLLVLPQGSVIYFWVTYDNTVNNPENPYRPPQKVGYSFDANSEMMELFLIGSPYQSGDENRQLQWLE